MVCVCALHDGNVVFLQPVKEVQKIVCGMGLADIAENRGDSEQVESIAVGEENGNGPKVIAAHIAVIDNRY